MGEFWARRFVGKAAGLTYASSIVREVISKSEETPVLTVDVLRWLWLSVPDQFTRHQV